MLGATALDGSDLRARYLLNIDSEEEGVLTVGCAGGARCDLTGTFPAPGPATHTMSRWPWSITAG